MLQPIQPDSPLQRGYKELTALIPERIVKISTIAASVFSFTGSLFEATTFGDYGRSAALFSFGLIFTGSTLWMNAQQMDVQASSTRPPSPLDLDLYTIEEGHSE